MVLAIRAGDEIALASAHSEARIPRERQRSNERPNATRMPTPCRPQSVPSRHSERRDNRAANSLPRKRCKRVNLTDAGCPTGSTGYLNGFWLCCLRVESAGQVPSWTLVTRIPCLVCILSKRALRANAVPSLSPLTPSPQLHRTMTPVAEDPTRYDTSAPIQWSPAGSTSPTLCPVYRPSSHKARCWAKLQVRRSVSTHTRSARYSNTSSSLVPALG